MKKSFLLILISALFISGCAVIPFKKTPSYVERLYKRIPYTLEGNYRVMNIFYATNRKVKEAKPEILFTRQMSSDMTYGKMDVKIDPKLKIEKMLPAKIKRKGVIGVQEVLSLNEEEFMKELKEAISLSPHKSLLVLVFGYKDNFEYTAIKTAYFSYLLDINTPVLVFDWPGDQPVNIRGYLKSRRLATETGPYLGEFLTKIIREIKPERLWLKASSLGCQVVCDALDYMYKYEDLRDPDYEIDHVVLAAPDVGKNDFDDEFRNEIVSLSKSLTTYVSSDDQALLLSGILSGQRKLGRQRIKESKQLEEMKDMLYIKSLHPDRVSLIDVTPIDDASYRHGYYLESPQFFDDLYLRIFDKKPNVNRNLYFIKAEDGTDYWILRKADR